MNQTQYINKKEQIPTWLSIHLERRGNNVAKNWLEKNPINWPEIAETANASLVFD